LSPPPPAAAAAMAGWYFTQNAVFMLVAAILAAVVVPLGLVLFVVAAWNRKQKIEWARRSYSYYLPAVAFLTFNCLLQACTHTASAVFIAHEAYWSNYDGPVLMLTLSVFGYLHPAAHFFDAIVEILVFLCLVNLAQGLVKAQTGSYSFRRLSNAAKLIIVFLLGGLAVYSLAAYVWIQGTGQNEAFSGAYSWCSNGYCDQRLYWSQMSATVAEADFASSVTIWVLSLLLAIWSGFILYRNNGEKRIKRVSQGLLAPVHGFRADPLLRRPSSLRYAPVYGFCEQRLYSPWSRTSGLGATRGDTATPSATTAPPGCALSTFP
jgi:hypothetical protein